MQAVLWTKCKAPSCKSAAPLMSTPFPFYSERMTIQRVSNIFVNLRDKEQNKEVSLYRHTIIALSAL